MNRVIRGTFKGATTPGFQTSIPSALFLIGVGILGLNVCGDDSEKLLISIGCILIGVGYIVYRILRRKKRGGTNE